MDFFQDTSSSCNSCFWVQLLIELSSPKVVLPFGVVLAYLLFVVHAAILSFISLHKGHNQNEIVINIVPFAGFLTGRTLVHAQKFFQDGMELSYLSLHRTLLFISTYSEEFFFQVSLSGDIIKLISI